jgi:hypothetical protein
MRKITKNELRAILYLKYNISVHTTQITLTKSYYHDSLMIVDGIGGMGIFRYGHDTMGNIKIYPNKMHEINLNV